MRVVAKRTKVFILVHGTGDGQASQGEPKWWEDQSLFVAGLEQIMQSGDRLVPFRWTGANDEKARRRAARFLIKLINNETADGERAVLIGHSHGGSVIDFAMSIMSDRERETVSLWSTIGTPFLHMTPRFLPWQRLSTLQTLSIVMVIATIFSVAALLFMNKQNGLMVEERLLLVLLPFAVVGLAVPSLHLVISFLLERRLRRARQRKGLVNPTPWIGIAARYDEAINGLKQLRHFRSQIFSSEITSGLVHTLSVLASIIALLAVPVLIIASLGSYDPVLISFFNAERVVTDIYASVLTGLRENPLSQAVFASDARVLRELYLGLIIFLSFTVFMPVIYVTGFALNQLVIGPLSAFILNRNTTSGVRNVAFGNSIRTEVVKSVEHHPPGLPGQVNYLPEKTEQGLRVLAADFAAETMLETQEFLAQHESNGPVDLVRLLKTELDWRGTIHTSYFRHEPTVNFIIEAIEAELARSENRDPIELVLTDRSKSTKPSSRSVGWTDSFCT